MAITDRVKTVLENIKNMPLNRKLALAGLTLIVFAIILTLFLWLPKQDYQVLYSNLSAEDAGNVINKLKEKKVPYQVKDNAIYVPSQKVHELRLELASQGIPSGGGVGFEIFDKTQIGLTEFSQRVNYIRALQGELQRTIKQLQEVDQVRVHIAIPEKSIFTEKEDHPTASVVLKLKPGRALSKEQVSSIVHLVSSSVEGLSPQYVTVVDQYGNLLSAPKDSTQLAEATHIEYKRNIEKTYEKNIQSMLENIVGKGKAIVRVSADIDFSKVEKVEEKYDPDTIAIRNEQRTQEKTMSPQQGGIPGVLSNQPGQPQTGATQQNIQSQKQQESINYEVSKSISKILQSTGQIKKISVAVLIDGIYKEEKGKKVYVPRSDEEIKKYQELVQASIGYNKERGDYVIVESIPFEIVPEEKPGIDYWGIATTILKYLIPLVIIALIILFVVKPIIELLKKPVEEKIKKKEIVISEEAVPPVMKERDIREEIRHIARTNPKKVIAILREWITE
ncbi:MULTISPECIES: flagellar basal-body MS-ring/collar protein FliF [Thermodesulfovibrio]|uniref:Flagellar M-ring protein n=1 Tax=Thermodesulfovibrio yellowstonii (strain ATCC 51303 / DSM 11347 / YP87) TaxID=289376 RepID=B5YI49_THEYD|nr:MULTISPECIES: flagellar basal-body MS-ring/collar protein FliF [Thermodesulfovibrio]ACI21849.1 flagellar M-ring protein FliF [Thermodesulfovibrio yellowstonii DSM 11347]